MKKSLLYFSTEDCAPCRVMERLLAEVLTEHTAQHLLEKIDISKFPGVAERFGISTVPVLVLIDSGVIADVCMGAISKEYLLTFLTPLLEEAATEDHANSSR